MKKNNILLVAFMLFTTVFTYAQSTVSDTSKIKRHEIGIFTSSTQKSSLSYKLGNEKWFGILTVGTNIRGDEALVLGLGAGRSFSLDEKSGINIEGTLLAYMFDEDNKDQIDKGFQLAGLYEYDLSKKFNITGGLTYSLVENNSLQDFKNKSLIPSLTSQDKTNKKSVGHFVGIQLGVNYKF